jgi:feruloyl-CoA synthase
VKGANVTPGYFRQPELIEAAFDEDAFYRSGDAVRLIDERDPNQGMLFDGRIAENGKLLIGTWVAVGALRTRLISAAGVLSDAVICGHDTEYVCALAWLNQAEAQRVTRATADVSLDEPRLREHLTRRQEGLNAEACSAGRIERLVLLEQPPSLDAGEMTDKGYLNQRRTLECRAAEVVRLYAEPPDAGVITASPSF